MAHISETKPDRQNARKHNPRNVGMIERSLQSDGFGRSILLANDGTIIAGNATAEAAASAGIEDMIVVESDGSKVIAVKRIDVEPGSERFRKLAVGDNRAAELADWDADVLRGLADDGVDLSQFWFDDELDRLLTQFAGETVDDPLAEWAGMPEFNQEDQMPVKQVIVNFASEFDVERFARLVEQNVAMTTKSIWYPAQLPQSRIDKAFVAGDGDAA